MPDRKAPETITPASLGDYLEVMSKAIFQTGMSWRVVESKWAGTCEAFRGFDVETVASMDQADIDDLKQDTRIIRSARKIEAIISNAKRLIELDREHGSFQKFLRSHADFESTSGAVKKEFKFLGDFGTYYFLYVVGEQVPDHAEWAASRKS